jgi:hypothetical protein
MVDEMPPLDGITLGSHTESEFESWLPPQLLLEFTAHDGKTKVALADYASLGLRGQNFTTWFPTKLPPARPKAPFTQTNPSRTYFVDDLLAAAARSDDGEDNNAIAGQGVDAIDMSLLSLPGSLAVKLVGGDGANSRRLRLPSTFTRAELCTALGLPAGSRLQWCDDEADWVELGEHERELAEAKTVVAEKLTPPLLRLRVPN